MRAGGQSSFEIIVPSNGSEPSSVSIGSGGSAVPGTTPVVRYVRASSANISTSSLKAAGALNSARTSLPDLTVEVSSLSIRPKMRVPDITDITRAVNDALYSTNQSIGIEDIIRLVSSSLNNVPIIAEPGEIKDYSPGAPRFFVHYGNSEYAYGASRSFVHFPSSFPNSALAYVFPDENLPPHGCVSSFTSGELWKIFSHDVAADKDGGVYVAIAYGTRKSDGTDGIGALVVEVFYGRLREYSKLSPIICFYGLANRIMPPPFSGSAYLKSIHDLSICADSGNIVLSILAESSASGKYYSFNSILSCNVVSRPRVHAKSLLSYVSGRVWLYLDKSVFEMLTVGDSITIAVPTSHSKAYYGGTWVIDALDNAAYGVRLARPSGSGSIFINVAGGDLDLSAENIPVAIGGVVYPYVQRSTNKYSIFDSDEAPVSTSIVSTGDKRFLVASSSLIKSSFMFASGATGRIDISSSDDGKKFERFISHTIPQGQCMVAQINVPFIGNNKFCIVQNKSISDKTPLFPIIPGRASLKVVTGPPHLRGDYVILASGDVADGTNIKSYYYVGDVFSGPSGPEGSPVSIEVGEPRDGTLSQHVAVKLDLRPGERFEYIHRPFLWSSYPSKSVNVAWACTNRGRIFRTIDGGLNWEEFGSPANSIYNNINRDFYLKSIFCMHADDPKYMTVNLTVVNSNARVFKITTTGGEKFPKWWPSISVELRHQSFSVFCRRANLTGSYGGFTETEMNLAIISDDNIGLDADSAWNAISSLNGQSVNLLVIPNPDVLVGGESGLLLRNRFGRFRVLSHSRKEDFAPEYIDEDFHRFARTDHTEDVTSISIDVVGRVDSVTMPVMNQWNSTRIAGIITKSNGLVAAINDHALHGTWVWGRIDKLQNESGITGLVIRTNNPSSTSISDPIFVVFGPSSITRLGVTNMIATIPASSFFLGTNFYHKVIGNLSNIETIERPVVKNVKYNFVSHSGTMVISGAPVVCGFLASGDGNVYYFSSTQSGGVINGFNLTRVVSLSGAVTGIECSVDSGAIELLAYGKRRDGTPAYWFMSWFISDTNQPVKFTSSSNFQTMPPSIYHTETLPATPYACVANSYLSAAIEGAILARRYSSFNEPVLVKPELFRNSGGEVYMAVSNLTDRKVDIMKLGGPGLFFYHVSSIPLLFNTPMTSGGVPDLIVGANLNRNLHTAIPSVSFADSPFGELIVKVGAYIFVSNDGGVTWHSGSSDAAVLRTGDVLDIPSFSSQAERNFDSKIFDASGGILGMTRLVRGSLGSEKCVFYFSRVMGYDQSGDGLPCVSDVDLYSGIDGLMLRWSGEPAPGDRYSVIFDWLNGASSIGHKSPSVKIVGRPSAPLKLTWDAVAMGLKSRRYAINCIAIFGTNFSSCKVRVSSPAFDGASIDSDTAASLYTLYSFCDVYGVSASPSFQYSGKYVGGGIVRLNNVKMASHFFKRSRRQFYCVVMKNLGGGNIKYIVSKIIDNGVDTLIIDNVLTSHGISPGATLDWVKIFSDRFFLDLNRSGDDAYARFVVVEVSGVVNAANNEFFYSAPEIGTVVHGYGAVYGPIMGKERRHRFSRGFSFRERFSKMERESEAGIVFRNIVSPKPRLEVTLNYDDALWHDRDVTISSLYDALSNPVAIVFDNNDPQSVEFMELVEEPEVRNTFGDRYSWVVSMREVV